MSIEQLFQLERLVFSDTMNKYGVTRHDLRILSACKCSRESLYTLEINHSLDRAQTIRRLRVLEAKGFVRRNKVGRAKLIQLTERSREVIRFMERIDIREIIN